MTTSLPVLLTHFDLAHNPFGKLQGPEGLWTSTDLLVVRDLVRCAIDHREMVGILGDYGTGKTTAVHAAIQSLAPGEDLLVIPVLGDKEALRVAHVVEAMLHGMGLDALPARETRRRLELRRLLVEAHGQGRRVLVVIDEAHRISGSTHKALKELHEHRYAGRESLFAIVLVGHRQLTAALSLTARDVLGRLEAHNLHYLPPLLREKAADYLRTRAAAAGRPDLFDAAALDLLPRRASPLALNILGARLLDAACAAGQHQITVETLHAVLPELRQQRAPEPDAIARVLSTVAPNATHGVRDAS